MIWSGIVATGSGTCSSTPGVLPPAYYHGSLNLVATGVPLSKRFPRGPRPDGWDGFDWSGDLLLSGRIVAINAEPVDVGPVVVGEYAHVEVVAAEHLRSLLRLQDGDEVTLDVDAEPMPVVVAIPWRPTPQRQDAHDAVVAWYAEHLPDAPLIHVDTDHERYNLAAARNLAVREAEYLGAEVVVIGDADGILASPRTLWRAIRAACDGRLHLPYSQQRYLTEPETVGLLFGKKNPPFHGSHGNGGIYVITPDGYWACGGSDERFSGWGGDDDGIVAAAKALTGVKRHDGVLWSLWHADEHRPVGSDEHRPNADLAERYWAAHRRPLTMRDLIAERPPGPYAMPATYRTQRPVDYVEPETDIVWQPDVYPYAAKVARDHGSRRLIDLGCSTAVKLLEQADEFDLIGVDRPGMAPDDPRLDVREANLDTPDPLPLTVDDLTGATVICSDVIEHLMHPEHLTANLRTVLEHADAVILSTPDRAFMEGGAAHNGPPDNWHHVREWTADELTAWITAEGFHIADAHHQRSCDSVGARDATFVLLLTPGG